MNLAAGPGAALLQGSLAALAVGSRGHDRWPWAACETVGYSCSWPARRSLPSMLKDVLASAETRVSPLQHCQTVPMTYEMSDCPMVSVSHDYKTRLIIFNGVPSDFLGPMTPSLSCTGLKNKCLCPPPHPPSVAPPWNSPLASDWPTTHC